MTSPKNPTKYVGPNVYIANTVSRNREPTSADYRQPETGRNYVIFCGWQVGKNPTTGTEGDLFLLSKIIANVAYWIKISSGVTPSGAILGVMVNADSAPGTNPVLPDAEGIITVTGAQVAAGTTPNVIRTDSLAANAYTIEIQRSQAAAASTVGDNGVCHFDSAAFGVDANGFVTLNPPTPPTYFNAIAIQTLTASGTYTPTTGMKYAIIEIVGGGGAGGGASATDSTQVSVGGGGGSGEYARGLFSAATIGASQSVTIGLGGTGVAGGIGNSGGNSSLGSLISAFGATGGLTLVLNSGITPAGGSGGSGGSGGQIRTPGNPGAVALATPSPLIVFSGEGGTSIYGSSGAATPGETDGSNAAGYGAGGGGGGNNQSQVTARLGGNGANGVCIITEYL